MSSAHITQNKHICKSKQQNTRENNNHNTWQC